MSHAKSIVTVLSFFGGLFAFNALEQLIERQNENVMKRAFDSLGVKKEDVRIVTCNHKIMMGSTFIISFNEGAKKINDSTLVVTEKVLYGSKGLLGGIQEDSTRTFQQKITLDNFKTKIR